MDDEGNMVTEKYFVEEEIDPSDLPQEPSPEKVSYNLDFEIFFFLVLYKNF